MEDINRVNVVLVEKKRTSKWLAEQRGVNPTTVSKWCKNSSQPNHASLLKVAFLEAGISFTSKNCYFIIDFKPKGCIGLLYNKEQ